MAERQNRLVKSKESDKEQNRQIDKQANKCKNIDIVCEESKVENYSFLPIC